MGMIFTQNFTHDTGRFLVGGVGANAHVLHGVEDTAVDGLETVTNVRDGAGYDDAHRIVEIRGTHFVVNTNRLKAASVVQDSFFSGNFRLFSHLFFQCRKISITLLLYFICQMSGVRAKKSANFQE